MQIDLTQLITAEDKAAAAAAGAAAREHATARAYLAETDWMVVRAAETGKPVPADVADQRAQARAVIRA